MICNECKSDAEFKQFSTFSYYYCQTCKIEVTAQLVAQDSGHPKLWTHDTCKHNRLMTEYCTDCKNETTANNQIYTDPEIKQLEELFSTLPDTITWVGGHKDYRTPVEAGLIEFKTNRAITKRIGTIIVNNIPYSFN